jgi:transglutaminase superfamily protein
LTGKDLPQNRLTRPQRLRSHWRRFCQLSREEKSFLLEALAAVPLASLALRLIGFRRLRHTLTGLACEESAASDPKGSTLKSARLAARMVAAASRDGLRRGNCLEQSIALCWLLHQRKIPAQLRIGARKQATGIEAHAWVELFGVVLNDGEDVDRQYARFARELGCFPVDPR